MSNKKDRSAASLLLLLVSHHALHSFLQNFCPWVWCQICHITANSNTLFC